jgi:uncharacterized membrane protein
MILLINRRYPNFGAVLSVLSAIVFITLGMSTHHSTYVIFSAAGIALSIVQFTHRRRHANADATVNTQK